MDPTIADLIASTDRGDPAAAEALFAALYRELHQLARRELARGGGQLSLGATTLLHEAYLNMSGRAGTTFPDRPQFMGYAARVMRSLIVDHARRRRAQKRGGAFESRPSRPASTSPPRRWRSSMRSAPPWTSWAPSIPGSRSWST